MTVATEHSTSPAPASDAGTTAARRTLGHMPALDGLRGLAVAAVLLYHVAQANGLDALGDVSRGGFLGVSAFFTLSGFLITSLLILEFESVGHITLGPFWGRRFRRLLPAALLTLAVVAVLTPLVGTQAQLGDLPGEIWSTLAYVVNWHFVLVGSDYAATFQGAPSPIKHFWSLAVEEQAYFVLPFLVAVCMRFGRRRRLLGSLLVALAGGSLGLVWALGGGEYSNRVYMGTDTRIGELAVGGVLAVAIAGRTRITSRPLRWFVAALGPVVLGMLLAVWATTDLQASWLYQGGLSVHAVAVAAVIVSAAQWHSPLQRLLSVPPLVQLGRVSYGVYLFHWPIVWWLSADRLGSKAWVAAVAQVALTLLVAVVSYRFVEHPIRSGRVLVRRQRAIVPVMAIALVAAAAYALPAPDPGRINALSGTTEAVIPTTTLPVGPTSPAVTLPPPPVRVMIVGDSFAFAIGPGLTDYALETGQMAVLNRGIVGCSYGRGGRGRGIGLDREWLPECRAREAELVTQLTEFAPDVVLMAGGMWDIADRKPEGFDEWTHIGEPEYDAYLMGEIQHLTDTLSAKGATVVWTTAPTFDPQYDPSTYMGRPPYSEAEPGRSKAFNDVLAVALMSRPGAKLLDLAGWMQSFPGGEFSENLRVDGVHFTMESTKTVANQFLGPELVAIGRARDGGE